MLLLIFIYKKLTRSQCPTIHRLKNFSPFKDNLLLNICIIINYNYYIKII